MKRLPLWLLGGLVLAFLGAVAAAAVPDLSKVAFAGLLVWQWLAASCVVLALAAYVVDRETKIRLPRKPKAKRVGEVYHLTDPELEHKNPICPSCYEVSDKTVPVSLLGNGYYFCPACQRTFASGDDAASGSPRGADIYHGENRRITRRSL